MITYNTTIDYDNVKYMEVEAWGLAVIKADKYILDITPLKRISNDHNGYKESVVLGILYIEKEK